MAADSMLVPVTPEQAAWLDASAGAASQVTAPEILSFALLLGALSAVGYGILRVLRPTSQASATVEGTGRMRLMRWLDRRNAAILTGAAVLVAMLVFPPWVRIRLNAGGHVLQRAPYDYSPIFDPPQDYAGYAYELDWGRLALQVGVVLVVAAAVHLISHRRS